MKRTLQPLIAILILTNTALAQRAHYLAHRTDGRDGTGMASDPYDASTPYKLASAWQKSSAKSDTAITFFPGTYTLTNDLSLPAGISNITVSGYGAQLAFAGTNMASRYVHVLRTSFTGNNDITFAGFRIDAGGHYIGPGKTCGILASGNNNTVRDCVVRNITSASATNEAFGIIVRGTNGLCSGNMVHGVKTFLGSGLATGILIEGESISAVNNSVDFVDDSETNPTTTFAYSVYASSSVLSGNTSRRCDAGIAMDGAGDGLYTSWRDNVITGNQFAGNRMCVRIDNNTQSFNDWLWSGNVFHAQGGTWLMLWTSEVWRTNEIRGHRFVGNTFTGSAAPVNMVVGNYGSSPHSFFGNSFNTAPNFLVVTNSFYGASNVVQGKPDNSALGVSDAALIGAW